MLTLQGDHIYLRALEPEDIEFIYRIENNERSWEISNTQTPYSRFLIQQYLENAHLDIYTAKQLRLVICDQETNREMGLIDLFDFDPAHRRAGIGILIVAPEDRERGYGSEALTLLIRYSFTYLHLHQLYANIGVNNTVSIQLFENKGFQKVGLKKDWNLVGNTYTDELLYQLIHVH